jgi:myosin heavy subunit
MKPQNVTDTILISSKSNSIIITLAVLMMTSWAFVLWTRNNQRKEHRELTRQYAAMQETRKQMQMNYEASLNLLDSVAGSIAEEESELVNKSSRVSELKKEINSLLRKSTLTASERDRANVLILQLKDQLQFLQKEIDSLNANNDLLADEKSELMEERDEYRLHKEKLEIETQQLALKLKIASTLNSSNISMTPLQVRKGQADRPTTKASKAGRLMIAFDVENRVIEPGTTDVYLILQDPDGEIIKTETSDTGTFVTSDNRQQPFTAVIPVEVQTGAKKRVEFCWNTDRALKKGVYYAGIYHNGFKIGESNGKW